MSKKFKRNNKMKALFFLLIVFSLVGCGTFKRVMSGVTGSPTEYCFQGVKYLQFPSGATIALDAQGKPLVCK